MKLFYILMLTALLSLFNVGCGEETQEGGNPQDEVKTDQEAGQKTFSVLSFLSKSTVLVESGDAKAELQINTCVAVPADKWDALKISVIPAEGEAVVVCDQSNEDSACGAHRHLSVRNPAGQSQQIMDSPVGGCDVILGQEEESEEQQPADNEEQPAEGNEGQSS
ncbi:MAG: hypothetical protein OXK80_06695 [Bdellovibrionales bacterium]|nr:hypothetical protein [Bdellovibrionales bacterium]